MNNPFLKYLMKDDKKEDIFHSSAYGVAQNGAGMGAASTQSFRERQKIEENRQKVGGYNRSGIMGSAAANGPRAKTYTPPARGTGLVGRSGASPRPMGPMGSRGKV